MSNRRILLEGHYVQVAPEVRDAVAANRAVVALESTIITHGMPYPANLDMARSVEAIVREEGAVPATVALLDGFVRVGLADRELEELATGGSAAKASTRDLAALLAKRAAAGTTVAATMVAAAFAGIPIFATGGIGGVHRGAELTFDVSADLQELGRTPIAVVCSGCKSILDIGKTLEVLETLGVPVVGYRADDFPGFFSRSSGFRVDHRFETPDALGEMLDMHRHLRLRTGILICNPVPEADALPAEAMERHIAAACREADAAGVAGKALTPFLLKRIHEITGGESLRPNLALIRDNARLAARIAVANAEHRARLTELADTW